MLKLPMDPLRLALLAMMVMTISRIHQHFGFLAPVRPALIVAIVALAYALMNPRYLNTDKFLRHWPAKVIAALGIMACISVPFALSIGSSAMYIIVVYAKVLVFAFLLIAAMRGPRDLNLFVWGYVIACGLLVVMAWTVFGLKTGGSGLARLSSLYTWDSNDVGCVLMTGLPLTLLAFETSRGKGRILSLAILVGIGATIARTGSRGAFVGVLAVGAALLFGMWHVSIVKKVLFVVVAGGALVLTAPQGYWEQMRTLTSLEEDYNWTTAYGRKHVWTRGIGYMVRNPLTGLGIHNFERAEGTISDVAVNFVDRPGVKLKWSSAHNSFIQVGAELGIPGLILWSSLIFGGIISMFRMRRRLPRQWIRGDPEQRFLYMATLYLPVSIIGFASTAFFLSFAYLEIVYILAAYVVGVYIAVDVKLGSQPPVAGRRQAEDPRMPAWRRQLASQRPTRR